ncbi:AraC family transcriptional regulator [Streptomyces sp. BE133]|uniref:AraC family transcriptional regulator n=1 Tax=Streptomyces sp. BE133 TaxID=3002523 RepID=UPI002E7809B3|nr:AraC family transcriptional regulator [Streptomyces sp. BE133]MEE1806740.1 AraC family transcriptional regulator [Streptomyces sp. BE133]
MARAWGFTDASHFTRRFRGAYGVTPRDWQGRRPDRRRADLRTGPEAEIEVLPLAQAPYVMCTIANARDGGTGNGRKGWFSGLRASRDGSPGRRAGSGSARRAPPGDG